LDNETLFLSIPLVNKRFKKLLEDGIKLYTDDNGYPLIRRHCECCFFDFTRELEHLKRTKVDLLKMVRDNVFVCVYCRRKCVHCNKWILKYAVIEKCYVCEIVSSYCTKTTFYECIDCWGKCCETCSIDGDDGFLYCKSCYARKIHDKGGGGGINVIAFKSPKI